MEIRKKVFNFGGSSGIIIGKYVLEELDLKEGDWVRCNIEKLGSNVEITKSDNKKVRGIVRRFLMFEGKPALDIHIVEEDKSGLIPFSIIKDIQEIKKL